jgi:23S rRNA pseudouridine1911/1915/1917 synthase
VTAATHTVSLTVAPEHAWLRVDAFLAQVLPWRSRRSLTELLAAGAVAVNGGRVKKAHRLAAGDVVTLELPRRLDAEEDLAAIPLRILHEDDDLVVVDKPGDLAMHPASTCQHRNLLRRLQHYYAHEAPGASGSHERPDPRVEPFTVHRLDRTTSGVVALVKRRALIDFYTRQFAARTTTKRYVAIVHGRLEGEGTIELPILTPDERPVRIDPAGKPSHTDWRSLAATDHVSRLAITLHTGRKHQIRVHLAAQGHPLVHDHVYGPTRTEPSDTNEQPSTPTRPLLHAAYLELDHRDGRRLVLEAPVPDDMERAWLELSRL